MLWLLGILGVDMIDGKSQWFWWCERSWHVFWHI